MGKKKPATANEGKPKREDVLEYAKKIGFTEDIVETLGGSMEDLADHALGHDDPLGYLDAEWEEVRPDEEEVSSTDGEGGSDSEEHNSPPAESTPQDLKLSISLNAPFVELNPKHYVQRHVDVQLDPHGARALCRLRNTLQKNHATLKGGKHVESGAMAVRWLFEQLSIEIEGQD